MINSESGKRINRERDGQAKYKRKTVFIIVFSGADLETGKAKFGNNAEYSEEPNARSQGDNFLSIVIKNLFIVKNQKSQKND